MYFKITCLFSSMLSRPTSSRRHTAEDKFSNRWAEPFSVRPPRRQELSKSARKLPTIKQSGTAHAASSRYPLPVGYHPSGLGLGLETLFTRITLGHYCSQTCHYIYYNYRVFVSFIHTIGRASKWTQFQSVHGYHFLEDELTVKLKKY